MPWKSRHQKVLLVAACFFGCSISLAHAFQPAYRTCTSSFLGRFATVSSCKDDQRMPATRRLLSMRKGSANSPGRRARSFKKRIMEEGGESEVGLGVPGKKKVPDKQKMALNPRNGSTKQAQPPVNREFESRKGARKISIVEMDAEKASAWKYKRLEEALEEVDDLVAAYGGYKSAGNSRKHPRGGGGGGGGPPAAQGGGGAGAAAGAGGVGDVGVQGGPEERGPALGPPVLPAAHRGADHVQDFGQASCSAAQERTSCVSSSSLLILTRPGRGLSGEGLILC
mmetsp:Transcript_44278/g.72255  ORF Transcript_44278/g.72255 Transcript_44278/m.72255 type:complete len:283 (-) Transcript_44278:148-996(-)